MLSSALGERSTIRGSGRAAETRAAPFDKWLRAPAHCTGLGRLRVRNSVEEKIAYFFLHYFLKVRRGQRMKGLLGFCSDYNGKPLMGFEQGNNIL